MYLLKIHVTQTISSQSTKKKNAGLKHFNYSRVFIQNSSNMDGTDKNIEEYNSSNKQKILIVFDYKIVDMLSNKKLN